MNRTDQERDATDMVFMTMGDEKSFDFAAVVFQISVIGNDVINAGKGRFWETNASVKKNDALL